MTQMSHTLVAGFIAFIAFSVAAVLYLALGVPLAEAGWIGVAVLLGLGLAQVVNARGGGGSEVTSRLDDIGRTGTTLTREVAMLNARIADLELTLSNRVEDALETRIGEVVSEFQRFEAALGALGERLEGAVPAKPAKGKAAAKAETKPAAAVDEAGEETAAADAPAPARKRSGAFADMTDDEFAALVTDAVAAGRIEIFLQPVVTLPQRKVRYYEVLSRLRTEDGLLVDAEDFVDTATEQGLIAAIDRVAVTRAIQVVRRLSTKKREIGVFVNLSSMSMLDGSVSREMVEMLEANRAIAGSIMPEFRYATFLEFGPLEQAFLDELAELGYRFSLDRVTTLDLAPRELADRRVRFVKIEAARLMNGARIAKDIHPEDLSDLLHRHGITLIATRIERESEVVDLLDFDVGFAQGHLFSPPRAVRADVIQEPTVDAGPGEPVRRAS